MRAELARERLTTPSLGSSRFGLQEALRKGEGRLKVAVLVWVHNKILSEADMNSIFKALPTLLVLLLAVLSLAAIVEAHDPVALLGWLFGVALVVTAGTPAPSADPLAG